MEYLVIELVNPKIDACAHHESGVATVSDGGDSFGVPWAFVRSELLNSCDEAKEIAEMLCRKKYEELKESVFEHNGWFIGTSCSGVENAKMLVCMPSPYTLFLCKDMNENKIFEEWLYSYDILKIDSYNVC